MKLNHILMAVVGFALLAAAGPATEPSGTRSATCDVDVWSTLTWNLIHDTSTNTGTIGDVDTELCTLLRPKLYSQFGIDATAISSYLTITVPDRPEGSLQVAGSGPKNQQRISISVTLNPSDRPVAKELLDAIIAELPMAILNVETAPYNEVINREQRAQVEFVQRQADLDVLKKQMIDVSGDIADRSPQGLRMLARDLDQKKQQLTMDLAAQTAEYNALDSAVQRLTREADQKSQDDPVANELEIIVKLKERKVDSAANQDQKDQAELEATEARVQLLERRETVAHAAGGDALVDLQKQFVQLQVDQDENKARLDVISHQLISLEKAEELSDEIETQSRGETNNASRLDQLQETLGETQRQMEQIIQSRPVVHVVSETASN